jgi:hypothetical protein
VTVSRGTTAKRIDEAIHQPAIRPMFEEYKRLVGLSAERERTDEQGHLEAAFAAKEQALRILRAVEGSGALVPEEAAYQYLANVAVAEMFDTDRLTAQTHLAPPSLLVEWPAGRPRRSQSALRAALIDRVHAQPGMTEAAVDELGKDLGVWGEDQADDYDSRRKRVTRIREAAAK